MEALFKAGKFGNVLRNSAAVRQLGQDAVERGRMADVLHSIPVQAGEEDLEAYRQSDLFKGAWSQVKPWFRTKPQAFSLVREMLVEASG